MTELVDRLQQIDPSDGVGALLRLSDLFQDRRVRGAQDCLDPAALVARVRAKLRPGGLGGVRHASQGVPPASARLAGRAAGGATGREEEAATDPSEGNREQRFTAAVGRAEIVTVGPRDEWRFTPRFQRARARLAPLPRAVSAGILASLMDGTVRPRGEGGNVSSYDFLVEEERLCILIAVGEHGRRRWCVGVDIFPLEGAPDPDDEETPLPTPRIEHAQEQWDRWVRAQRTASRTGP